ncbi:MAG: 2-polyprenyl-6-methoxyphenol hydroxylase, partial [Stellaceae bacterium]
MRELAFGTRHKPVDTGQAVWRAMVRRPSEVKARYMFYGARNKAGFNPVSEREMYIFMIQTIVGDPRIPDERLPGIMREQLADFGGLVAEVRDEVAVPERIAYRPFGSMLLPPPWYEGRVVLVGDAAHTPTPQMASGAGIA